MFKRNYKLLKCILLIHQKAFCQRIFLVRGYRATITKAQEVLQQGGNRRTGVQK